MKDHKTFSDVFLKQWMIKNKRRLTALLTGAVVLLGAMQTPLAQDWQTQIRSLVQNGSVLAVDEKGTILFSLNADKPYVPASTLKVPTALAALKILGPKFRFPTEFYTDAQGNLYIKGFGDPFLVSEEFPLIVNELKAQGLKQVQNMILDTSYFDPNAQVEGLAGSLNPYDAYNGALLANFNTINIVKSSSGEVQSGETQTPITEISKTLAAQAPVGKSRINVATHREEAPLYVGYLLKEFLSQAGIPTQGAIKAGAVPANANKILTHQNSKNLGEVLRAGLKYSQNLIMNQTFLTMGVAKQGAPATIEKAQTAYRDFLKNDLGLQTIQVFEGSGISRQNQVTALEMDKILVAFFPYYTLLPEKDGGYVKTGTLKGVSCLVGYFKSTAHGWVRFVIFLNQAGAHRESIAKILQNNL
jgi:D-alanyl-D-alanine carboxypeptidase/D-alanyl-D-alanine-endopeptidase (penicillin-binding protein 4)